jgi:capsular polysaccharide biosynthesis protein
MGVHGGALTNLLFAPAGCLVIELMPEHADRARRQLFWNLAAISEQPYAQIVCPVAGDHSEGTLRVDVRVDAAHLADVLGSVLR